MTLRATSTVALQAHWIPEGGGGGRGAGCGTFLLFCLFFGCAGSEPRFYQNIPQLTSLGGPLMQGLVLLRQGPLWTRVAGLGLGVEGEPRPPSRGFPGLW